MYVCMYIYNIYICISIYIQLNYSIIICMYSNVCLAEFYYFATQNFMGKSKNYKVLYQACVRVLIG